MKIQRLYGTRRNLCRVLMFTAAVFTPAIQASAAPAGGGLPWEAPMTAIATSLTGPVAYAIGLIGIAIAAIEHVIEAIDPTATLPASPQTATVRAANLKWSSFARTPKDIYKSAWNGELSNHPELAAAKLN